MNDGAAVDPVDFGEDSLAQLRQGSDADMAKHGAGELGEKSLDEIEPGAVFGRVDEREASFGLLGEPSHRLLGFVGGVIVEDELDRGLIALWVIAIAPVSHEVTNPAISRTERAILFIPTSDPARAGFRWKAYRESGLGREPVGRRSRHRRLPRGMSAAGGTAAGQTCRWPENPRAAGLRAASRPSADLPGSCPPAADISTFSDHAEVADLGESQK